MLRSGITFKGLDEEGHWEQMNSFVEDGGYKCH